MEITSSAALASITATVFLTTGVDVRGSVAVTQDVPPLAPDASSAALVIQAFSVIGSSDRGSFSYWPKLTLTETSGVSRAVIKTMTFELMDVGPSGRVPVVRQPREVPAGGTITFDEDDYGYGPWLESQHGRCIACLTRDFICGRRRARRLCHSRRAGYAITSTLAPVRVEFPNHGP